MKKLSPIIALILTGLLAGAVLGHTATPTCDHIILANSSLNATIYVHGTSTVALGPVAGNHTYAIAPGTYDVIWTDQFKVNNVVVGPCATPTPSPSPTASPTPSPSPTASPTATPVVTPSETPVATPTASIPNTSMSNGTGIVDSQMVVTFIGVLLIGLSLMLVANAVFGKRKS